MAAVDKRAFYSSLSEELATLLAGESDLIANAANTAALLYERLDQVNWAGFYLRRGDELVLGPFQGKPACVRIALGKGVCGTAAERAETTVVADVHGFPGHIACDVDSRAEVVVPIMHDDRVVGVLDVDSPIQDHFDAMDGEGLERVVEAFLNATDIASWPGVGRVV